MERLTYDFTIGENHCWQVHGADNDLCADVCRRQNDNGCDKCPIRMAFDRLAAYEDTGLDPERIAELAQAEADDRLVVLPCKAGDTLWTFYTHPSKKVYSFSVTDTSTLNGATTLNTDRLGVIPASDVGKTVFLTREAAEAALKEWEVAHKEWEATHGV